jgi:hypothetical protein
MADMSNIVDFNNSDGLSPDIVKKLNNNFFNMANKIVGSDIVMVAGINPPDPRTDETLFYKTDTGDLYIWSKFIPIDPDTQEPQDPYWDWMKIDINLLESVSEHPSGIRDDNAFIKYYITDTGAYPYFWIDYTSEVRAQWISLIDLIKHYIQSEGPQAAKGYIESMTMQDWLDLPNFENAVRYIINHPSNP